MQHIRGTVAPRRAASSVGLPVALPLRPCRYGLDLPNSGRLVRRDAVRDLPFGFFPLYLPELFPTRVRATGQGICYNTGRLVAVPFVLLSGKLVESLGGYQQAAAAITLVYGVGLLVAFLGKETSGQALQD